MDELSKAMNDAGGEINPAMNDRVNILLDQLNRHQQLASKQAADLQDKLRNLLKLRGLQANTLARIKNLLNQLQGNSEATTTTEPTTTASQTATPLEANFKDLTIEERIKQLQQRKKDGAITSLEEQELGNLEFAKQQNNVEELRKRIEEIEKDNSMESVDKERLLKLLREKLAELERGIVATDNTRRVDSLLYKKDSTESGLQTHEYLELDSLRAINRENETIDGLTRRITAIQKMPNSTLENNELLNLLNAKLAKLNPVTTKTEWSKCTNYEKQKLLEKYYENFSDMASMADCEQVVLNDFMKQYQLRDLEENTRIANIPDEIMSRFRVRIYNLKDRKFIISAIRTMGSRTEGSHTISESKISDVDIVVISEYANDARGDNRIISLIDEIKKDFMKCTGAPLEIAIYSNQELRGKVKFSGSDLKDF